MVLRAAAASAASKRAVKSVAGRDRSAARTSRIAGCTWPGPTACVSRPQFSAGTRRRAAITAIRSCRCAPSRQEAAEARRLTRCLAVAGFAAMNIMLLSVSVWSGNVTDITPETRDFFHWASALIALPAAAYAGRPFFASAWRALKSRVPQYGRADLARRHPCARHVAGGNGQSCRARLFRFRHHAAVLPAGRARARSCHAPQDARGGRQSGGPEGGYCASLIGDELVSVPVGGAEGRRSRCW